MNFTSASKAHSRCAHAPDGCDHKKVALHGLQVFDDNMPGPNQLSKLRQDVEVTADDLLRVPEVRVAPRLYGLRPPAPRRLLACA